MPSLGAVPIDLIPGRTGFFPKFASYLDGVLSTAGRLASPVWPTGAPYGERTSIRQIFDHPSGATWAPLGDAENDPNSYLASMLRLMNTYSDQADEWVAATIAPRPFVYQDYLTTNYTPGRRGNPIRAAVLHVTQGESAAGCINWFKNPVSQVSSHFVLDRNGTIYATVRETDSAWVNGRVESPNTSIPIIAEWVEQGTNPNLQTLGIECAGFSPAQPHPSNPSFNGYTEQQFASLDYLLPVLSARWDIPIDPDWVFGHAEISGTQRKDCPGLSAEEWERVYAMDEAAPMTDAQKLELVYQGNPDAYGDKLYSGELTRPYYTGMVLRCTYALLTPDGQNLLASQPGGVLDDVESYWYENNVLTRY
jgi:N-acetyl-anhydromuramyl-L-alanine amidase AmpD